jgi:hypothetical protein
VQVLDLMHAFQNAMACAKVLLGEAGPLLSLWERRINQLLDALLFDVVICELMECLLHADVEEHLAVIDRLVGYYRRCRSA